MTDFFCQYGMQTDLTLGVKYRDDVSVWSYIVGKLYANSGILCQNLKDNF